MVRLLVLQDVGSKRLELLKAPTSTAANQETPQVDVHAQLLGTHHARLRLGSVIRSQKVAGKI